MKPSRAVLGVAFSALAAGAIAWVSQLPTTYAGADDALIRLSWRVDGVHVDECRPRTEEELAALAPHMRTPEVCTRSFVDHELTVALDGRELVRDTLEPGGARRDRPVYVYRDIEVTPGRHALRVSFSALVPDGFDPAEVPIERTFDQGIDVGPTEVALIGLDPETSALTRLGP